MSRANTMIVRAALLALLTSLGLAGCVHAPIVPAPPAASAAARPGIPPAGYFDPHSHLSGVLPWQAYADLPAFLAHLEGRGPGVTRAEKLAFYTWLARTWYPKHANEFDDQPFSSTQRFGLGARATLVLDPPYQGMSRYELDGALDRISTATPFTEFDSAYAFHGPAYQWLGRTWYSGHLRRGASALCTAQILELARQHIDRSEQSISFIGGWRFDRSGHSYKLASVLCAARRPAKLKPVFQRLHEAVPRVHIILMTHTDQLAEGRRGRVYRSFENSGRCHWQPLRASLKVSPKQIYRALTDQRKNGTPLVAADERTAYLDTVVGIDTAGPESTCFTKAGMRYYQKLIGAVYHAARTRRSAGWTGKLLVHTHVGEGFTQYYARHPPRKPWTFASVFSRLPVLDGNVITNARAPRNNITMLLGAVRKVRAKYPDLDDYVVIRFGHVTHATRAQARRMARLRVEADVNLDSNLATGAWSFAQMPQGKTLAHRAARAAANPDTNFELNDLPGFLIPNPRDPRTVAAVLGTHPLKYLLMAHVRVMLGSDGTGVEHSSMPREYALAGSLIRYWKRHDPAFERAAPNASARTFLKNAALHFADMAGDTAAW